MSIVHVAADLTFTVETPQDGGSGAITGHVHGNGSLVQVFADDPVALARAVRDNARGAGGKDLVSLARGWAEQLAGQELRVSLEGPRGMLAELGGVRPSRVLTLVSGSPHVRLGRINRDSAALIAGSAARLILVRVRDLAATLAGRVAARSERSPGSRRAQWRSR